MKRFARISFIVWVGCGPRADATLPDGAPARSEPAPLAQYGADHVGFSLPDDSVCKRNEDGSLKNPIAEGTYSGVLRNARCRQQKFLTMAYLAQTLGVECNYCHVPDPEDPKKELFPLWTDRKRTANWMLRTFVQGLRRVDGKRVSCEDCHTDRTAGKPVTKILGEPRDRRHATLWMHDVMASDFVQANGERLRCKTCHVGMAPGTADWSSEVIRRLAYDEGLLRLDEPAADPAETATDDAPAPAVEEGAGPSEPAAGEPPADGEPEDGEPADGTTAEDTEPAEDGQPLEGEPAEDGADGDQDE